MRREGGHLMTSDWCPLENFKKPGGRSWGTPFDSRTSRWSGLENLNKLFSDNPAFDS